MTKSSDKIECHVYVLEDVNQYNKNASSHNIVLLQLTKWLKNDQVTGKNNCTKCIVVWKNSLVVL
jgi:hypothetical protein